MSLTIKSYDSNSINTLFSSLPATKNASYTGIEGVLSDYRSLQTGSYQKLVKSYFDKFGDDAIKNKVTSKDSAEVSSIEKAADALVDDTKKLLDKNSSLWEKKSVEKDGKTITEYDRTSLGNAISSFVDSYNSLVDKGQKSSNTGILTQVAGMVKTSSSSISTLSQIGITVNSNNHLSFDKDYFSDSADMTVAKSLFTGNNSYAYSVSSKASMVKNYANNLLSDITGRKSYTNSGSYDLSAPDILSSFNIST